MYRKAKQRLGDPVLAWADVVGDPERRRRYHQARGKGGLVRVSWAEAVEMIAAAQVHTIKTYGPDRIAGFSPTPAMSMVSHCVGTRFTQLIGGVMTSFYDWYADNTFLMGATYNNAAHSYTIGLVLLTITASTALLFTLFAIR
jgi:nitrate reductase alpha subunit